MKYILWLPVLFLAACGSKETSTNTNAAARLKDTLFTAQHTLSEYRMAFMQAQLRVNNWVVIASETDEKAAQQKFVDKEYPAMREKMAKQIVGWDEDLRGEAKRMLVSSDSLVANYKSIMELFSGIDAYLGEQAIDGRSRVQADDGAVKVLYNKLDGQIEKLGKGVDKEIDMALSELTGTKN